MFLEQVISLASLRPDSRLWRAPNFRRNSRRLSFAEWKQQGKVIEQGVVYQWESRKRTPSPVFWKRVEALGGTRLGARAAETRHSATQLVAEGTWIDT
jgi:hypothetical protein